MAQSIRFSRRRFVALAGGLLAAPLAVHARVIGANERILTGHVGVNNRGKDHVAQLARDVAALCDVDQQVLAREHQVVAAASGKCDVYNDYRKLLDCKDIDGVVIATPDHWHALIATDACAAGKDVYCEKPLALTVSEGRAMVAAARRHGRVFQTGSQQRSDPRFRLACELVRSGRLGRLERVEAGLPQAVQTAPPVPDGEPPSWLDYDRWLGPAPKRPYNPMRIHMPHRTWRWWWDYSGGQMTNWGAHHLDIVQWALDADNSGPVEISGKGQPHPRHWFPVPVTYEVAFRYASGLVVRAGTSFKSGVTFFGSEGRLFVTRGEITSDPPDITRQPLGETEVRLDESADHLTNWLDSLRSRKAPICDVEIGHRSATAAHLGNIAIRTGRTISWDPAVERILNDDQAQQMLTRPYRPPWRLAD